MRIGNYDLSLLDKYNWGICKIDVHTKGTFKGEEYSKVVGYYRTLELAGVALQEILVKDMVFDNSKCTISDVLKYTRVSNSDIINAIKSEHTLRQCCGYNDVPLMVEVEQCITY